MSSEEFFKTPCEHCGGRIEVPLHAAGQSIQCPHCQQQTVARHLAEAHDEVPEKNSGAWLWIGLAAALIAMAAGFLLLWQGQRRPPRTISVQNPTTNTAPPQNPEPRPKNLDDLKVSNIRLEAPKGSGLRYALGAVKNDSEHQRFGITIELALYDKSGQQLSSKATDYTQMLEPHKEWRFRALILDSKAASAKLASIKEQD